MSGTGFEVAGIDLSLTSTGIARACWDPADMLFAASPILMWPFVRRIQSKGAKDATLTERQARLADISGQVTDEVDGADLVVIEGPSYGSNTGSQHDRSGLWWSVVSNLIEHGQAVIEVSPHQRQQYATGRGNASKDQVLAAAIKRYPLWDITGNDIADAVILTAIGARAVGRALEDSLPQTHLRALDKLRIPTLGRTPA